jgi:hypothetical protein
MTIHSKAWAALRRALGSVKKMPSKIADRIENQMREKDKSVEDFKQKSGYLPPEAKQQQGEERKKDYITVPPSRRHEVMNAGRRIIK